jgi:hypothetical protein
LYYKQTKNKKINLKGVLTMSVKEILNKPVFTAKELIEAHKNEKQQNETIFGNLNFLIELGKQNNRKGAF